MCIRAQLVPYTRMLYHSIWRWLLVGCDTRAYGSKRSFKPRLRAPHAAVHRHDAATERRDTALCECHAFMAPVWYILAVVESSMLVGYATLVRVACGSHHALCQPPR